MAAGAAHFFAAGFALERVKREFDARKTRCEDCYTSPSVNKFPTFQQHDALELTFRARHSQPQEKLNDNENNRP
jgi:hypothetical protein